MKIQTVKGCGIGLRREFITAFKALEETPDWIEITPENWFSIPHRYRESFEQIMQAYPAVAHGVSLSIGSPEPVDKSFLMQMKAFLDRYKIAHYSEHLSFSSFQGRQTYELLPVSMTKAMLRHLCDKIERVQETLERALILENSSYYLTPYSEMREVDFICELLERSNARLLLDVNNVYVNAVNHGFDADAYIAHIPPERTAYIHVAGHLEYPEESLLLDTHGEAVCEEVWSLLERTLKSHKVPVMIERDNNIPPLELLMDEFHRLRQIKERLL